MNRPDLSIAALAPFFLSSFAWNFALGSTYILVPLYALSLGMTGVQIGALVALLLLLSREVAAAATSGRVEVFIRDLPGKVSG